MYLENIDVPCQENIIATKKYYASRGIFGVCVTVNDHGNAYSLAHNKEFDWGYKGVLPGNLARCILIDYAGKEVADTYYRDFEEDFIACMPERGFVISGEAIRKWIEDKAREA